MIMIINVLNYFKLVLSITTITPECVLPLLFTATIKHLSSIRMFFSELTFRGKSIKI